MTQIKFYDEDDKSRFLEVGNNGSLIDFFIVKNIKIDDGREDEECLVVELTIEDAERLMDELHRQIIKAEIWKKEEGGKECHL